jgi:hypothetical protein
MGDGHQNISEPTLDLPLTEANASALLVIIDDFIQNAPPEDKMVIKAEELPEGMTEEDFRQFMKNMIFQAHFLKEEVAALLREQYLTEEQETKTGIILPKSKFE